MNWVLVCIRSMAEQRIDYSVIAAVADIAEYLPLLVLDTYDRTDDFRACLADIGVRWPMAIRAISLLDGES